MPARLPALALVLALAGCGLKGNLYLPPPPEPVPAGEPPALPPAQPQQPPDVESTEDVDSGTEEDSDQ